LVVTAPERPPGAVDLGFLKALFRECRRCHLTALYVDSTHMVLVYSGTRAHGRFRLALKPVDRTQDHVLLALPPRVEAEADEVTQPLPDTRPSVARRVLDALTAEVAW
ncbi:MAG: hypothetical protein KC668_30590, partial [Myxococcales bacterium]|nr:hypothetical protein [Myxococcales bacterium]